MAKKEVSAVVKIQIPAGKATPAPPVGTALGPHGIQIMEFVKQYASNPGKEVAGSVSERDIEEIAKRKMPDLNANDIEAAKQQVRGTARSMGLTVTP